MLFRRNKYKKWKSLKLVICGNLFGYDIFTTDGLVDTPYDGRLGKAIVFSVAKNKQPISYLLFYGNNHLTCQKIGSDENPFEDKTFFPTFYENFMKDLIIKYFPKFDVNSKLKFV